MQEMEDLKDNIEVEEEEEIIRKSEEIRLTYED